MSKSLTLDGSFAMITISTRFLIPLICCVFVGTSILSANAAEPSAQEVAAKLSASRQDGNSYIRVTLTIKGKGGENQSTLQLAIKSRRTETATDVLYQVLWPKERKSEAMWLRQTAGGSVSGSISIPPDAPRAFGTADLKQPLFGSDLSLEDVVDNFYAWDSQTITGTETFDGVVCQILESKPGGVRSSYSSVRSWVDTKRMVPLRVEKYSNGNLIRRLDAARVVTESGREIVATLNVTRPGQSTVTELEGSKIRRDVTYGDGDFTSAPMKSAN